jgi:hypothetical protein
MKAYRNGTLILEQPVLCIPTGHRWDKVELNAKDIADLHSLHLTGDAARMRDVLESMLTLMVPDK